MKIAIRVDASYQIGTGHVMRCLTLADELSRNGASIRFVCRGHLGQLCETIASRGFEVVRLKCDPDLSGKCQTRKQAGKGENQINHAEWLGVDQKTDAWQTIDALRDEVPWDWLIVDHYGLDKSWESALRESTRKIMVIDDLADRHHDCDLLLDQTYLEEPEDRYGELRPEHCVTLLGPQFALLRPEFRLARQFTCMRGNGIARVLVYCGGNDSPNLTGLILEALDCSELRHLHVEVVAGPNNRHLDALKQQLKKCPGTRLHIQPESFVELMLRADLSIGAGGTTTWERLSLGLPSIVVTQALNQETLTRELNKAGYVNWVGEAGHIGVSDLRQEIVKRLKECSTIISDLPNIVDGRGVLRVLEALMPSPEKGLHLRYARKDDMSQYFFWVNDPLTTEYAFRKRPITWAEHVAWFSRKVAGSETTMWVLETLRELPVGQIRFDIKGGTAEIDYSLDPLVRGRGWANILLQKGLSMFEDEYGSIVSLGRVKKENLPSRRVFQRLGFSEKDEGGGVAVFASPCYPTMTVG